MNMNYIISPENTPASATTLNFVVYLEKDFDDIGFYTVTDGDILQEKNKCNFTYTASGKVVTLFNSSDKNSFVELKDVIYKIYWGDGSSELVAIEQSISHTYSTTGKYELTLKLETPWTDSVKKTIEVGGDATITNPFGTLSIKVPYSDATFEQDFISLHDAVEEQLEQDDVFVSGFTKTRLSELLKYGQKKVVEGLDSNGNGVLVGGITDGYTAYTIDNIFYTDFPDGLTYFHNNVGDNPLQLLFQLITKDDGLMGVVEDITVQSDVYVERGTISVFEHNLRLCEVDSVGEIEVYGNKYFNVKRTV
jgi:hypothetical protein